MNLNKSKIIYLITTKNCSACNCMKNIFKDIQKDITSLQVITLDFQDVPLWIKNDINLTDFPTVVFVENNVIKYSFVGTKSRNKIINIMRNINY